MKSLKYAENVAEEERDAAARVGTTIDSENVPQMTEGGEPTTAQTPSSGDGDSRKAGAGRMPLISEGSGSQVEGSKFEKATTLTHEHSRIVVDRLIEVDIGVLNSRSREIEDSITTLNRGTWYLDTESWHSYLQQRWL